MEIKPAQAADVTTIATVLRRAFATTAERFGLTVRNCPTNPAFATPERVAEDMARGMRYYLLAEDGRARGCVAMEQADDADLVYLGRLGVVPEERSQGFGRALVEHVLREAERIGVERVELGLMDDDAPLKQWYGRFGFRQTSTKRFEHLPFLVAFMAKELRRPRGPSVSLADSDGREERWTHSTHHE